MGRLRTFSGRDICDLLASQGFREVRQKGSHIIMQSSGAEGTTTVPVPNHSEIKIGTLASIIRQSRLPRNLFEV